MRGFNKGLGCPIFEGRNKILLLGKAPKFGVIYQKSAQNLLERWKIIEKFVETGIFVIENFIFHSELGKNREYKIEMI